MTSKAWLGAELGVFLLLAGVAMAAAPKSKDSAWKVVAQGALISVEAETVLYEAEGSEEFWVRFRVRNLAARPVGVQLDAGWQVFYPNQWSDSPVERRQVVDERRLVVAPLAPESQEALRLAYSAGRLIPVPARGEVDYFRPFNGSGSLALARAAKDRFFLVVVDGQLLATDGAAVEQLKAPADDAPRELAVPTPVRWDKVPEKARRSLPR